MGWLKQVIRGRPAGGFTTHSVLLSILLVVATSGAAVLVMLQVIGAQVERAADGRLADGALRFEDRLTSQRHDLQTAGAWLTADPTFQEAAAGGSRQRVTERLQAVLPSHLFAYAEVTGPAGDALATVRDETLVQATDAALQDNASAASLRAALAGQRTSRVAVCGPELLCQQLVLPILAPSNGALVGTLRLVTTFSSDDLARFGATNGYEASVFDGTRRLMTTLRHPDGTPLTDIGTSPEIYRQVTGNGVPVSLWRDTPAGRIRSLFLPLRADDGTVVGMYSLGVRETSIAGAWRAEVLPVLPITLIVIAVGAELVWLLSREVRRPILSLAGAAARLGGGDLDTPIPAVAEPALRPLAEQLEVARQVVRERVQTLDSERVHRRQLLHDVAHELRGPLTVLENALEILSTEYAELSADEFGRLTHSASNTAVRLRTLMEDLLNAGTIESGRLQLARQPTPLSEIFAEAVGAVRQEIDARGQQFELSIAPDLAPVSVDERYVRQALINLLGNASKFTPAGSVIRLRARSSLGQVRITVEDNGPGIPAEHLPHIFERFYRADPAASPPGSGLGLAIARGVVEAHGGNIGVESAPGQGTTVWLTLPVAEEATG